MMPDPTLVFTLPSLHDGTVLDCRVFHPQSLGSSPRAPHWRGHAAVFAHPYAPLGGCYDDPVVDIVAATLLRLGYLVGTFNFRGASGSAGRTSWTAKAERADYISVVGFITYYAHLLDPFHSRHDYHIPSLIPERVTPPGPSSPIRGPTQPQQQLPPLLIMGGYSYGAMITTQIPRLEDIHALFQTPLRGSPAAEIRHRAEHLAATQNTVLGEARIAATHKEGVRSPRRSLGLRVGGDEDNRKSHETPHVSFSFEAEERIRKGVADMVSKARRGHWARKSGDGADFGRGDHHDSDGQKREAVQDRLPTPLDPAQYRAAYLLISPLQGFITNLATLSFPSPFPRMRSKTTAPPSAKEIAHSPRRAESMMESRLGAADGREERRLPMDNESSAGSSAGEPKHKDEAEQKLVRNPTLAVYGDRDVLVAAKKLREWGSQLEQIPGSLFRAHEVSTAGHFWIEGRTVYAMRDAVGTFAEALLEK